MEYLTTVLHKNKSATLLCRRTLSVRGTTAAKKSDAINFLIVITASFHLLNGIFFLHFTAAIVGSIVLA